MPYNFQVLGTVIASVLEYDHFIKITGDPAVIDPDASHPKASGWIPADGRSIAKSALSKLTGSANAPDLRGLFLRGLNTIYNNGEPQLIIGRADEDDPGSNRRAGDYQGDDFKTHDHGGGSHAHNIHGETGAAGGRGSFITGDNHSATQWDGNPNMVAVSGNIIPLQGGLETRPRNVSVYYYIKIN